MGWRDCSYTKKGLIIGAIVGLVLFSIIIIHSIISCWPSTVNNPETYFSIQSGSIAGSDCKYVVNQEYKNLVDERAREFSGSLSGGDGGYISLLSYLKNTLIFTIIFIIIFGGIGSFIGYIIQKIKSRKQTQTPIPAK